MDEPTLPIRRVGIDTWRENVAFLHRDCPVVRAAGFQALAKVRVQANGQTLFAVLNVVDDACICEPRELGLSEEAFRRLGVEPGHPARIEQAEPAASIAALHRQIAGERLARDDLRAIVQDIAAARYSRIELAAFVVATNQFELDRDEVLHLTEAMIASGQRIDWQREVGAGPVVDKHCIGGIRGNRTSMVVVPIVAAHGMLCPKTSSRAITSPAGTADTMEVLAEVELPMARLKEIVRATHGCLAWGGTADLSAADDLLISVGRPLASDTAEGTLAKQRPPRRDSPSAHDVPLSSLAACSMMNLSPFASGAKRERSAVTSGANLAGLPLRSSAPAINRASSGICAGPMPRRTISGTPRRRPLVSPGVVTGGDAGVSGRPMPQA